MLERVVVTVGVGQKTASPIVIVPAYTPLTEEVELPPPQLFVALTRSVSVPVDVGVPENWDYEGSSTNVWCTTC